MSKARFGANPRTSFTTDTIQGVRESHKRIIAVVIIVIVIIVQIDIVAFMIARYFGLRSYATIYALSTVAISLGIALGASLIGRAYDYFGDYDAAIAAASASYALAAVLYLMMGRYPQRPGVALAG